MAQATSSVSPMTAKIGFSDLTQLQKNARLFLTRAEGDPNARPVGSTCLCGLGEDMVDLLLGLLERLPPQAEYVGKRASDPVRFGGTASDGDRDVASKWADGRTTN